MFFFNCASRFTTMSEIPRVKPPSRFCLGDNNLRQWKLFKQRWTGYSSLTELGRQPIEKQRSFFLQLLDDDALELFNSFTLSDDCNVDAIIKEFDKAIIGTVNVTYERFQFNRRQQEDGESFDVFLADIQRLIKTCEYCAKCKDSILKDKIVVGVRDEQLQKDLLKVKELNLNQAIDQSKASEKAVQHNQVLRNETVHKLSSNQVKYGEARRLCRYCGNMHPFRKEVCPAYKKSCKKCNKMNHFAKCCRNVSERRSEPIQKRINYVGNKEEFTDEEEQSSFEWIYNLQDPSTCGKYVKCVLLVGGKRIHFQIDSGSSVNIIPEMYVSGYDKTAVTLSTWNNAKCQPLGECRLFVKNPKTMKKYSVKFIVCQNGLTPILGLSASEQMNILKVEHQNFERVLSINLDN